MLKEKAKGSTGHWISFGMVPNEELWTAKTVAKKSITTTIIHIPPPTSHSHPHSQNLPLSPPTPTTYSLSPSSHFYLPPAPTTSNPFPLLLPPSTPPHQLPLTTHLLSLLPPHTPSHLTYSLGGKFQGPVSAIIWFCLENKGRDFPNYVVGQYSAVSCGLIIKYSRKQTKNTLFCAQKNYPRWGDWSSSVSLRWISGFSS